MPEEQDNNKEHNTVAQDNVSSGQMDTRQHLTEGCTLIHYSVSQTYVIKWFLRWVMEVLSESSWAESYYYQKAYVIYF